MKNIELDELPKSKEFMKHAKIADGLTKETGLEHGFTFCKPSDKIIVDKMCVGDECSIHIGATQCKKEENLYHTHPGKFNSELSEYDLYSLAISSFNNDKPSVSCVKGDRATYIRCDEISIDRSKDDERGLNILHNIEHLIDYMTKETEAGFVVSVEDDIIENTGKEYEFIEFNANTGNIEVQGRFKEHNINKIKRMKEKMAIPIEERMKYAAKKKN